MTATPNSEWSDLDEAVVRYEQRMEAGGDVAEAVEVGQTVDPDLQRHIAIHRELETFCAPLRRAVTAGGPPPTIPGYCELKEIGRGGMGVVYRAIQSGTGRAVAIKVIRPERLASMNEEQRRMLMERFAFEPIATMDHNNIVRVYHADNVEGTPFFVMELVNGVTLRALARSSDCGIVDVVAHMEQAARGLHHAHQHGVLHRDIKPANIMIDLPTSTAKLADFGLAKLDHLTVDPQASAVRSSDAMGTLPYMSPEQLVDSEDVTIASDVYGLGAALYEALSGQPPFIGSSAEVRTAIRDQPPRPLREIRPAIPRRLERICLRCLCKRPEDRFGSASEFADELAKVRSASRDNAAIVFANMGFPLIAFGVACLLIQIAIAWEVSRGFASTIVWGTFFCPHLLLFAIFATTPLPLNHRSSTARRELWTVWGGHLALTLFAIVIARSATETVSAAMTFAYPLFAAATGMAILAMAANFWRFYLVMGTAWMFVAALMLFLPGNEPLGFGIAAAVSSITIGCYELHLMREQVVENLPTGDATSQASSQSLSLPGYLSSRSVTRQALKEVR